MTTLQAYSPIVRGVAAAATGLSGLAAGLALSYSYVTFPAIARMPGLTKKQNVDLWKAVFNRGAVPAVRIPVAASVLFAASAICASVWQDGFQVATLASAAAFSIMHLPFTIVAIFPVNKRLEALHKKHILTSAEEEESSALIEKWLGYHLVRVFTLSIGFALGLKALAE